MLIILYIFYEGKGSQHYGCEQDLGAVVEVQSVLHLEQGGRGCAALDLVESKECQ